jgi:hypothetical protein
LIEIKRNEIKDIVTIKLGTWQIEELIMLKDEFQRLMTLFHEAAEGKTTNLEEVFKQSLQIFQHMKEQMAAGTQEDKTEAMKLMAEMYQQMNAESKRISEVSGLTEEQLVAFAENPANFTPEQWSSIQASKEQIVNAGQDLATTLERSDKTPQGVEQKKPENKGPKDKKGKKSEWMRS